MPTPDLIKMGISSIEELAALATLFSYQVRDKFIENATPRVEGDRVVSPQGDILYEFQEPSEYMPPEQIDYSQGLPTGYRNARSSRPKL